MAEALSGARTHLHYLDTIRGLAALTVIGSHYVLAYGLPCLNTVCEQVLTNSPLHIWWDGYAAVSLFFVLSGLVLSLKYFKNADASQYLKLDLMEYGIVRFFRIWAPYAAILLFSAFLNNTLPVKYDIASIPQREWLFMFWKEAYPAQVVAKEMLLWGSHELNLLPQAWTLTLELIISFMVPMGILLMYRHLAWLIFFTFFAMLVADASFFVFHFMLGIVIARYFKAIPGFMNSGKKAGCYRRAAVWVVGFLLYTCRFTLPVYVLEPLGYEIKEGVMWGITGLGSALLLVGTIASPALQKALSGKWLTAMGKVSYSIYLLHFAVLLCITPAFLAFFSGIQTFSFALWWAGLAFTLGLTLLLAIPSYAYIEKPSMVLGKWISRKAAEGVVPLMACAIPGAAANAVLTPAVPEAKPGIIRKAISKVKAEAPLKANSKADMSAASGNRKTKKRTKKRR